jgi:hypothetical protein
MDRRNRDDEPEPDADPTVTGTPATDRSVVLSQQWETVHGLTVENGTAYDRAAVDLGQYKKVVLPHDAAVWSDQPGPRLGIYMQKNLSFHGHPPEPMSIAQGRKNMGCAVKAEGDALVVATDGEWDSHIEGGASMRLVILVPKGIAANGREKLSGEQSAARDWRLPYITKPKEVKEGYWYGPASPRNDWLALPANPDSERRANGIAGRARLLLLNEKTD